MTITETSTRAFQPAPPKGTNRLFQAGTDADLNAHLKAYGPLRLTRTGPDFITELEASGLIGRGGAGFPAWRKLAATRPGRAGLGSRKPTVVIANGAEGEPRSNKDKTLLRNAPHLVIDGLLVAAAVLRATETYIYTTSDNMPALRRAIAERPDAKKIVLVVAAHTFVSGEASAVVNAMENDKAVPTDRLVRLSDSGLHRKPTLVNNVETLAHIALIARFGAAWFRTVGSERDPGTRLLTVTGDVGREAVLEVPGDTTIGTVLEACEARQGSVEAVLIGGYHGAWVPAGHSDAQISPDGLAAFGAHPGAGVLVVLGKNRCGLKTAADIVNYLAQQSARQCGPCMYGLPAIGSLLTRLAGGERNQKLAREIGHLSKMITGRGSCHHPDGTTRMVLSTLSVFSDEIAHHLSGHCTSPGQGMAGAA